jgi:hypothetical protein
MAGKPRHANDSAAARMRRSRSALSARGGRLVQIKLDAESRRALCALELMSPQSSRADAAASALTEFARQRGFPARLSREEECRLAALANGPWTVEAFRRTGYADAFLAGLALAFASDRRLPRQRLLVVAKKLSPDIVSLDGYRRWLAATPIRLVRLFKLVDIERGIASARDAA